jgi:cytochrome c556
MIRRVLAVCACALVPVIAAADADENPAIEYRESLMTLIANNFGPISAMVEGKIPWNAEQAAGWGKDLKALSGLNAMRGFPPGSEGGHAKPEIWGNLEDFRSKMETMQLEAAKLGDAAMGGDKAAIGEQLAAAGKACKSCHDEYKKKDD